MGRDYGTQHQALEEAREIIVTDHAREKGFEQAVIAEAVRRLDGTVYLDTGNGRYHLVNEEFVAVIAVKDGARVVITVYPNDSSPRYHQERYVMLQG